ncbi:MAG: NosD domain-containing protein [Candidatus Thorarchaeota archaeon]
MIFNNDRGIYLCFIKNLENIISGNTIQYHNNCGIILDSVAEKTLITWNYFIENYHSGESQA